MAESDRFLVSALVQSNCLPARGGELNIHELVCEDLFAIVLKCLTCIQHGDSHLDLSLPTEPVDGKHIGVAAKHRIGSQLANVIKELGYAGDCGYNHFLYPNEKETRSLLAWLVGKLPSTTSVDKESSHGHPTMHSHEKEPLLSETSITSAFSQWKSHRTLYRMPNRAWKDLCGYRRLPFHSRIFPLPWAHNSVDTQGYWFDALPHDTNAALCVMETMSSARGGSRSRPFDDLDGIEDVDGWEESLRMDNNEKKTSRVETATPSVPVQDTEEPDEFAASAYDQDETSFDKLPQLPVFESPVVQDMSQKEEREAVEKELLETELQSLEEEQAQARVELMHVRLLEVQQQIVQVRADVQAEESQVEAIQTRVEQMKEEGQALKNEIASRKQMLALLPQAQENIVKLETICAKNEAKLQTLSLDWKNEQKTLLEEEKVLTSMKATRKARCRQFIQDMKCFRTEMKEMAQTIQEKMNRMETLNKKIATLPQTMTRTEYTNRIMDIIKQVSKQKQEINKVVEDITSIQKQLNTASETLKRSEAVTEDKLYHQAQAHQAHVMKNGQENVYLECYRKFAQVRELFEQLIMIVTEIGKKESNARDLENWIVQLQSRHHTSHLEKVLNDLQSVRQENANLTLQLKELR